MFSVQLPGGSSNPHSASLPSFLSDHVLSVRRVQLWVQIVVLEGFPSVVLVLSSCHEKLILQVLEFWGGLCVDETVLGASSTEEGVDVVAISLVLDQDLLPSGEEVLSILLRDSLFNVLLLEVSVGGGARNLGVLEHEFLLVGLLDDVQGHLEQVVSGVGIDTPGSLHEALVLHRVRLVEETLTGETGLLSLDDLDFVLEDVLGQLLVGLLLGVFVECAQIALVGSTSLEEGLDELLASQLSLLLELH